MCVYVCVCVCVSRQKGEAGDTQVLGVFLVTYLKYFNCTILLLYDFI